MISKELKSQINILRETNPEYIQTLKDSPLRQNFSQSNQVLPKKSRTQGHSIKHAIWTFL